MRAFLDKQRRWLLPTVLILFMLEVVAFPFAVGFTWAGRSEVPERILTYTQGKLTWDSTAGVDENGAAELPLFEAVYQNVDADNGEAVVAPGTEGSSIVRLKNSVDRVIKYTAVLYRVRSTDLLPVDASLSGEGFTETNSYELPQGVKAEDVIRAVSGTVDGGKIRDFDIDWNWRFYDSDEQDVIDTWLGDKAAGGDADDVIVGLYIVVEDEDDFIDPDPPKTGDAKTGVYIVLMCLSGAVLLLLLVDKMRSRKCAE